MDNADLDRTIGRLRAATTGMIAKRAALEAGRPWPLHGVEHDAGLNPPGGRPKSWPTSPRCWRTGSARSSGSSTARLSPCRSGRTAEDRLRILTIERDRTLPPRELLDRIDTSTARYASRFAALSAAELARRGLHPTLGQKTVVEMLERFVVGHAEGHLVQLDDTLGHPHGVG